MSARLTRPQAELLDEIREKGRLYIRAYGRYGRTIRALERRGFVVCDEPDHSSLLMDGWVLAPQETKEGKA